MIPYTRPALSKEFLRGEMTEDELPIEPAEWYAEHDVTVLHRHRHRASATARSSCATRRCASTRA